jgi:hypothetical protein
MRGRTYVCGFATALMCSLLYLQRRQKFYVDQWSVYETASRYSGSPHALRIGLLSSRLVSRS